MSSTMSRGDRVESVISMVSLIYLLKCCWLKKSNRRLPSAGKGHFASIFPSLSLSHLHTLPRPHINVQQGTINPIIKNKLNSTARSIMAAFLKEQLGQRGNWVKRWRNSGVAQAHLARRRQGHIRSIYCIMCATNRVQCYSAKKYCIVFNKTFFYFFVCLMHV